jgi:hypothetical protein
MAACGEQDYSDWIPGSVASPGGSVPDEQQQSEEEIVIQAVRKKLSRKQSSRRSSTAEERKASVEKLVRESSKMSTRSISSPSSIDKAVKYHEMHDSSDTTSSAESYDWDIVQIKSVKDVSTLTAGDRDSQRWKYVCMALFCLLVLATGITVPLLLLLNGNNSPSSKVAPSASGSLFAPEPPSPAPTAAPVMPLPENCMQFYDVVDKCLSSNLEQAEANHCVDCVWQFLPANQGYCAPLERAICNVIQSCECSSCEDELISYIDCQTECLIDCKF